MAQDLTPYEVSEGRNGVCGGRHHSWEQAGLRGIESWQAPVEPWCPTCLQKVLSPGQARSHVCATGTASPLWQLLVQTHLYPCFVSHLHSHSNLHGPLTDGNACTDNLVSGLALGLPMQTTTPIESAQLSHAVYHQNA
jgi:hypothetical protein